MNETTREIIGRLPPKPILSPGEIAAAYGTASAQPVINAIEAGEIGANRMNGRWYIARREAERWIAGNGEAANGYEA